MKKELILSLLFLVILGSIAYAVELPGDIRTILNMSDNPLDYRLLESITFSSGEEMPNEVYDSWDVVPGKIKAWIEVEKFSTPFSPIENRYFLTINSDETIYAPSNCNNFFSCFNVSEINLNNFDTSNTTLMKGMFADCCKLASVDISKFNTSNVTDTSYMFDECYYLQFMDLSELDTSNVSDLTGMFNNCSFLAHVNMPRDLSNVKKMGHMFANCHRLEDINFFNCDFSKVTDLSDLFLQCNNLQSIIIKMPSEDFTSGEDMFERCNELKSIRITNSFENEEIHTFWADDSKISEIKPVLYVNTENDKMLLRQNAKYVETFGINNIRVYNEKPVILYADMDEDGQITIIDVKLLLQYYINQ